MVFTDLQNDGPFSVMLTGDQVISEEQKFIWPFLLMAGESKKLVPANSWHLKRAEPMMWSERASV